MPLHGAIRQSEAVTERAPLPGQDVVERVKGVVNDCQKFI